MVDFNKLIARTPEEKAAAEAEVERARREYWEKIEELLRQRLALVDRLMEPEVLDRMRPAEADFVSDMHRLGHAFDPITKTEGGRLTCLSSAQVSYLKRIEDNYLCERDVRSRAQRFGT